MEDANNDFFTPAQEAFIALHEVFEGLMMGGFSEEQAMTITARYMQASGSNE